MNSISLSTKAPDYRVIVNGSDITRTIRPRLISLTLTDNQRFEADTIELELDDADGLLAFPSKGATMQIAIGFKGAALSDKGSFTVDEIEHYGPADVLVIRGKAADMRDSLQVLHDQSYHGYTLGNILKTIAGRNNVNCKVADILASDVITHIDQNAESDAAFLTRLAKHYDAVGTIKNGTLLFMPAGQSKTASGSVIPTLTLTRMAGDKHYFTVTDRNNYTGVKAIWQDDAAATRRIIKVIRESKGKTDQHKGNSEFIIGGKGNIKVLRTTYSSQKTAERAAKSEWEKMQRNVARFSLTLAVGQPDIFPETPVAVRGFKQEIDDQQWIITQATHRIATNGLTTSVELEVKNNSESDSEETTE